MVDFLWTSQDRQQHMLDSLQALTCESLYSMLVYMPVCLLFCKDKGSDENLHCA